MRCISPDEIDALLPQTQCGLCGFDGCMPYAEALAYDHAPINLCPPGGLATLHALGELLREDATPYIAEMRAKQKPAAKAVIIEEECIGCTKCIQACPVDAIIGAPKLMHTILTADCTGCELCIPPCPVDCITMVVNESPILDPKSEADYFRELYLAKEARKAKTAREKQTQVQAQTLAKRKNYIEDALARVKTAFIKRS